MSEPFVPPTAPQQPPPPSGIPLPGAAPYPVPPPKPQRRRRRWIAPVVIVSVIAVVTVIVILVSAVAGFVGQLRPAAFSGSQPLVGGEPGTPTALEPLACPQACFTEDSIERMLPPESSFELLGTPNASYPWGTYDPTTVGALYRDAIAGWENNNGTPDSCFFAPTSSPIAATPDPSLSESTDVIEFAGTHQDTDQLNGIDQSVRIFPSSDLASAYLSELANATSECEVIEIGPPSDRYTAEITPAPELNPAPSVADIGWVRTGDPGPRWRAYTIDLQRGNVVVRLRLLTDGSISENKFRSFVRAYSTQLSLVPVESPTS